MKLFPIGNIIGGVLDYSGVFSPLLSVEMPIDDSPWDGGGPKRVCGTAVLIAPRFALSISHVFLLQLDRVHVRTIGPAERHLIRRIHWRDTIFDCKVDKTYPQVGSRTDWNDQIVVLEFEDDLDTFRAFAPAVASRKYPHAASVASPFDSPKGGCKVADMVVVSEENTQVVAVPDDSSPGSGLPAGNTSGAPLLVTEDNVRTIAGIHSMGGHDKRYGGPYATFVPITSGTLNWINSVVAARAATLLTSTSALPMLAPERFSIVRDDGSNYCDCYLLSFTDPTFFDNKDWIIDRSPSGLLVKVGSTMHTTGDAQKATVSITTAGQAQVDVDLSPGGWQNSQWHWLYGAAVLGKKHFEVYVYHTDDVTIGGTLYPGIQIEVFKQNGNKLDDRPIFHHIVPCAKTDSIRVLEMSGDALDGGIEPDQDNVGNGHEH